MFGERALRYSASIKSCKPARHVSCQGQQRPPEDARKCGLAHATPALVSVNRQYDKQYTLFSRKTTYADDKVGEPVNSVSLMLLVTARRQAVAAGLPRNRSMSSGTSLFFLQCNCDRCYVIASTKTS